MAFEIGSTATGVTPGLDRSIASAVLRGVGVRAHQDRGRLDLACRSAHRMRARFEFDAAGRWNSICTSLRIAGVHDASHDT